MISEWKWRLIAIVPASEVTQARRRNLAKAFADNSSRETEENEDISRGAVTLSRNGRLPAEAYAINTAAKLEMRNGLRTILQAVPNARYWVTANTEHDIYEDGALIQTNTAFGAVGEQWTFDEAIKALGLSRIEPEAVDEGARG